MAIDLKKRKFTSEAYHLMAEAGIFSSDERIELLNGEIINMSPVNNQHIGVVNRINFLFSKILGGAAIISVQNPISINEYSEPEPDLTICRFKEDFYADAKAKPQDILLLIEVSDTTLAKDREVKLPLYAKAGIQTYWIVNVVDRQIEVYANPKGNAYQKVDIYREKDIVEVPEFSLNIPVTEILG